MNIYLIFYILFFKLAFFKALKALIIEINLINLNIKYKIEIILNCQYIKKKVKYLIKWKNYLYLKNI